MTGKMKSLYF